MKLSCFASGLPVAMLLGATGVTLGDESPQPGLAPSQPVFEEISMMKDSFFPLDDLVTRGDGAFYGVVEWEVGGKGRSIVRLVPGEDDVEVLHQFSLKQDAKSALEGREPIGGVVLGADGALYGACMSGGANGKGTIYRLSVDGVFSVVCDLEMSVYSGICLVASTDGLLYGVMSEGGPNDGGILFSVDPDVGVLTTLVDFEKTQGEPPAEGELEPFSYPTELALGADGKLYGRCDRGGPMSAGSRRRSFGGLFRYDGEGGITVLHNEVPVNGFNYLNQLVPIEDGFLISGRTAVNHLAFDGTFTTDEELFPVGWGPRKPLYVSGNVYGVIGEYTTEAPLLYRYGPSVEPERIHDFSADYDSRAIKLMAANDGLVYGLASLPSGYVPSKKRGTRPYGTRVFRMKPSDAAANHVPFAQTDVAWLPEKATQGKREVIVDVLKNDSDQDGDALTITEIGGWEGIGGVEVISTPAGQRIRVESTESDPMSSQLTYTVSDGHGGVATGTVAVQSQVTGTFRGNVTGEETSTGTVTVVLGKNHTLKATMLLDGVSYSGKGLLDVEETADVSLRAKGGQAANLHLELWRTNGLRGLRATVVKGGVVREGDCAPVVK